MAGRRYPPRRPGPKARAAAHRLNSAFARPERGPKEVPQPDQDELDRKAAENKRQQEAEISLEQHRQNELSRKAADDAYDKCGHGFHDRDDV